MVKPRDVTSHGLVKRVRSLFKTRKVGHAGTLDPFAVGVLVICIGKATRISEYLTVFPKTYRGEITLGVETDTQDPTGRIIYRGEVPKNLNSTYIASLLKNMVGSRMQIPPMYSAIKQQGKKLYQLARKGQWLKRKPRPIHIHRFQLLGRGLLNDRFLFEIECSKGTYIRSLAAEIGQILGCGAHLSFLVRTKVGSFTINNCFSLRELEKIIDEGGLRKCLIPVDQALAHFPSLKVSKEETDILRHGGLLKRCRTAENRTPLHKAYGPEEDFIGIVQMLEGAPGERIIKPKKIF